MKFPASLCLAIAVATGALAEGADLVIAPPAEGSVSTQVGLEAWARIYEVASHPRCANCHTGPSRSLHWNACGHR